MKFKSLIAAFLGLSVLVTGCYRDEFDRLKEEVNGGSAKIEDLDDAIVNMDASVKDLESLRDQLAPAVEALEQTKDDVTKELAGIRERLAGDEQVTTEMKAQIISLETELKAIDAAIQAINDAKLSDKIEDLNEFLKQVMGDNNGRLSGLEKLVSDKYFATADALANLEAAVKVIQDAFDDNFKGALDRNKDEILSWINKESSDIRKLFESYYTSREVDALLDAIRQVDSTQTDEIAKLQKTLSDNEKDLAKYIEELVGGAEIKLNGKLEEAEKTIDGLADRVDKLTGRVVALEKVADCVGDYENFEGTLIDAIKDLQAKADKNTADHTEISNLLDALKAHLTDARGRWYDFEGMLDDIYSNAGRIGDLESAVKALQGFSDLQGLISSLGDKVTELGNSAASNKTALEEVTAVVDSLVRTWTVEKFDKIEENAGKIIDLLSQDELLWEAVRNGADLDRKRHDTVIALITEINRNLGILSALDGKVDSIKTAAEGINKRLAECSVSEIKGLEKCLENLDQRIKDIAAEIKKINDVIGVWDSTQGTIAQVIALIQSKFGDLGGKTIADIIDALKADIGLIEADIVRINGDNPDGQNLTTLKVYVDTLQAILSRKADAGSVEELKNTVVGMQEELKKYIEHYDDTLKNYLLSSTAAQTYAKITAVQEYIDRYAQLKDSLKADINTLLGQIAAIKVKMYEDSVMIDGKLVDLEGRIGTIEGNIVTINGDIVGINSSIGVLDTKIGNISDLNWSNDIISALNTLYSSVNEKTDSLKAAGIATSIAQKILDDFIKTILGKDGDASAVKSLLDSFANDISSLVTRVGALETSVGDLSWFTGSDLFEDGDKKDISTAIKNIKTILDDCSREGHTHTLEDIIGLEDYIKSFIGVLDNLQTSNKDNLVDAINELLAKFGGYTTSDKIDTLVNPLISAAEAVLANAILNGDKTGEFKNYFSSLNLARFKALVDSLCNEIDIIIKEGGTIDTRATGIVNSAIKELNISQYLTIADLNDTLDYYLLETDFAEAKAIATALASLSITIDGTPYGYLEYGEVLELIFDSLNKHILNYNALKSSYSNLLGRVDDIEGLVGDGIDGKTLTEVINTINTDFGKVSEQIDSINTVLGDIVKKFGADTSVAGLIGNLEGLYKDLIKALLGKPGQASDITDAYSLDTLKKRLDAIGFSTIKNADASMTLQEVLDTINTSVGTLYGMIGNLGSYKSVAEALAAYQTALGAFVDSTAYKNDMKALNDSIDSVIKALTGSVDGKIENLTELKSAVDGIVSRLNNFNSVNGQTIEAFADKVKRQLDSLAGIIGDTTGTGISNLSYVVDTLMKYVNGDQFKGKVLENAAAVIRDRMGVTEILSILGGLDTLKTSNKANLVSAINEIVGKINNLATKTALNQAKIDILGEGYSGTVKGLMDAIDAIEKAIGTMPSGVDWTSIGDALGKLNTAFSDLQTEIGTAPGSQTVWEAIAVLQTAINNMEDGDKSLMELLHSCVFISDYADGSATITCNSDRTKFNDLTVKFNVTADSQFATNFTDYTVKGVFHPVKVRTKADGDVTLTGTAVLSEGVMTVKFAKGDLSSLSAEAYQLSVTITDETETFASQYIPLFFTDSKAAVAVSGERDDKLSYSDNTITSFYASQKDYQNVFDISGYDVKVTYTEGNTGNWLTVNKDGTISVSENTNSNDRTAKVTISVDGVEEITISVKQLKKMICFEDGTTTKTSCGTSSQSISLINNFGYTGPYQVTATTGSYRTSSPSGKPTISSGKLAFRFSANTQSGTATVSTQNLNPNILTVFTLKAGK